MGVLVLRSLRSPSLVKYQLFELGILKLGEEPQLPRSFACNACVNVEIIYFSFEQKKPKTAIVDLSSFRNLLPLVIIYCFLTIAGSGTVN